MVIGRLSGPTGPVARDVRPLAGLPLLRGRSKKTLNFPKRRDVQPMTITQERNATTGGTLTGRVALVTGGTAGLGAAISRQRAGDGAIVGAGHWRHPPAATQLQAGLAGPEPASLSPREAV